jgi:hypothetical protein
MKPYKVGSLWVDLDIVLAADDQVSFLPSWNPDVTGNLYLAGLTEPIKVYLGRVSITRAHGQPVGDYIELGEIKDEWAAFLTAWKERDTMFGSAK